jgi:putative transposase
MINTREIAKEYRLAHWAQVMRERTESGLSIKEFCRQVGICGNTYFYWQRRLRTIACAEPKLPVEQSAAAQGWVTLSNAETSSVTGNITVEIGGCRITVDENTDTALLAKVCRALKTL